MNILLKWVSCSNSKLGYFVVGGVLVSGIALLAVNVAHGVTETSSNERQEDPVVEHIAQIRGISIEEAKERADWQQKAQMLSDSLELELENDFGGVWIGQNDDRVKVGVAFDHDQDKQKQIRSIIDRLGVEASADTVKVKYSLTYLNSIVDKMGDELRRVNADTDWTLSLGVKPSENTVLLTRPSRDDKLTHEQATFIISLQKRYQDAIKIRLNDSQPSLSACDQLRFCDAPLRGGVGLNGSNDYGKRECTSGFIVLGNSGQRYVLTAGHCSPAGNGWATKASNGILRKIGPIHRNLIAEGKYVDGMIIKIRDQYNWSSRGWVFIRDGQGLGGYGGPSRNESYTITNSAVSSGLDGQRVCLSGSSTGSSCGPVEEVNVSNTFYGGNYRVSLVRTSLCAQGGDSGGPVTFQGNALGVFTGGVDGCTSSQYYTGFRPIRREMDNTIQAVVN